MSELKTPTINGLVEKLYDEKYIEDKEKDSIKAILEQSTSGMEKDDITLLIAKLNAKIDARSSDLITQNRLNYASFDDAIKTSTREIKKEKAEREKSQAQSTVDPLQENKNIEKTPQEKAEIERQERIAANRRYIDDLLDRLPGGSNLGFTDEEKDKIAEAEERWNEYDKYYNSYLKEGDSNEVASQKAKKQAKISNEQLNSGADNAAIAIKLNKIAESVERGSLPEEEGKKQVSSLLSACGKSNEEAEDISRDIFAGPEKRKNRIFSLLSAAKNMMVTQQSVESIEADRKAMIYDARARIDIKRLKGYIDSEENGKKVLRNRRKENYTPEEENERKSFFENLTKQYLASGQTISELYDDLQGEPIVQRLEMEFEDFLDGIKENLDLDTNNDPVRENNVNSLINTEREIRRIDILNDSIEIAENNGKKIDEENKKKLKIMIKKDVKYRNDVKEIKKEIADRRNIKVEELSKNGRNKKNGNKLANNSHNKSEKQLEKEIQRITNDRKQIIRIAKEKGISSDEAAKIYFTENKNALSSYTRKERRILIEGDESKKSIKKPKKILSKLRALAKIRNNQLISIYNVDFVKSTRIIEELKKGVDNPRELDAELKKLETIKRKLKKAQERGKNFERKTQTKTAMDILDERVKKNAEKEIFVRYIESGKSAVEILEEIEANGNEHGFNKEDLLRIIEDGVRRYLVKGSELNSLIENEKTLFDNTITLAALRIKIENAEKKGLVDWIVPYNKQLAELETYQKVCKSVNGNYKNIILTRMGKNPDRIRIVDEDRTTENGLVVDSEQIKVKNSTEVVQEQEGQTIERKSGLEVEQIEITGIKPNVKAIAQKSKVTPSRVKKVFAKIVGLGKSKEKDAEQKEQETGSEEKTNKTNSDTGVR